MNIVLISHFHGVVRRLSSSSAIIRRKTVWLRRRRIGGVLAGELLHEGPELRSAGFELDRVRYVDNLEWRRLSFLLLLLLCVFGCACRIQGRHFFHVQSSKCKREESGEE
ncbi:hypothetical protein MIMGU_mgv1a016729mg [Erythranthe guttata]|uniref:Uncharacterized protein n=1 Tax=Erythranthe guttata TaxID=4155 RepID=A0A022Q0Y0_ERYGU|nr:hypothetical protein MIMGU_mgv1a016729mg [Erythranthe guttata]